MSYNLSLKTTYQTKRSTFLLLALNSPVRSSGQPEEKQKNSGWNSLFNNTNPTRGRMRANREEEEKKKAEEDVGGVLLPV